MFLFYLLIGVDEDVFRFLSFFQEVVGEFDHDVDNVSDKQEEYAGP